ncbi:MAG: alanine racemase [Pseudomonadota bacterium]
MSPVDAPAGATGVIRIDLATLAANWRSLADLVRPAECAAVVKADAYGLGVTRVAPALAAAGCRTFFVATLAEAETCRQLLPGATLYVLDGLLPGSAEALAAIDARPVLSSLAEVCDWVGHHGDDETRPAALHVDTGLNRLGMSAGEVRALAADGHLLDRLQVSLVMSHLACADEPASPKSRQQRDVFEQLRPLLPSVPASLAASDGLMLGPDFHYDLVRPGYALYGGQASVGRTTPVAPVISVHARILQVHDVAPGQTVGYAASYRVARPSRIATIAAGYADGVPRQASAASGEAGGRVAIDGIPCPIVGRVSMDLVTVDVTDLPRPPQVGDLAELIGDTLTLEDVGRAAGTIGYEVLTRLGHRFHRVYLGAGG